MNCRKCHKHMAALERVGTTRIFQCLHNPFHFTTIKDGRKRVDVEVD